MNEAKYLELVRIARRKRDALRSARSALYRAHTYREGLARDCALTIVREQIALARLYNRRLMAGVRHWNTSADHAYTESGAIVCKLSPRLVASTVMQ